MEVDLITDILCYRPKRSTHAKSRVRETHEKAQAGDFRSLYMPDEDIIIIPNAPHREMDITEEENLHVNELIIENLEEEEEDFNNFVHRATSISKMTPCEDSPWGVQCACPCYDFHASCKYVINCACDDDIITKLLGLTLEKLT